MYSTIGSGTASQATPQGRRQARWVGGRMGGVTDVPAGSRGRVEACCGGSEAEKAGQEVPDDEVPAEGGPAGWLSAGYVFKEIFN
jgi:hypothetical protein